MVSIAEAIGPTVEESLARIAQRVDLTETALRTARENWAGTTAAIQAGASPGERGVVRFRYLQIRRLADEARRIILRQDEDDATVYAHAIDPHLIEGYCAYWDESKFAAFDFIRSEWQPGEESNRTEFIVFLLGAILRTKGLICLDAGKHEISEMLGYFLQYRERSPITPKHLESFDKALREIVHTTDSSQRFGWSQDQISEFIWGKFDALISAGGIPLMSQSLSQARLAKILKEGRLKSTFAALRERLDGDSRGGLALAETYYRAFLKDIERSRMARTRLYEAYTTFGRLTDLGQSQLVGDTMAALRPGEFANINALAELRLVNACLAEAGVNAQVRYITSSQAIYNFAAAFDPDSMGVELTHPRHLFIFENKATPDNLKRFEQVLTRANAFIHAVPRDNVIGQGDLDQFDAEFADLLRDVRSTYSFAPVDSEPDRSSLASVIAHFALNHTTSREEYQPLLDQISNSLAATSEDVAKAFKTTVSSRTEQGFSAYREFITGLEPSSGSNQLLIRAFGCDSGSDESAASLNLPRLVCIAVNGGYRNLFKLYYPPLVEALRSRADDLLTIGELLDIAEDCVGSPNSSTHEGVAQLEFVRAVYAMANSEWLLSLNLGQSALDLLDFDPNRQVAGNLSKPQRRMHLIAQETLILRHSARRGIASNLDSLPRRQQRLRLAARDLYEGACATESFDDAPSFATVYNPNSVRHAIGAVAFAIEWLALKEVSIAAGIPVQRTADERPLLPKASFAHTAWSGLSIAEQSLGSLLRDPTAVDQLLQDAQLLVERVQGTFDALHRDGDSTGHSVDFWRYILLKSVALKLILHLMIALRILPASFDPPVAEEDLDQFETLLADHDRYASSKQGQRGGLGVDTHPFSNFVLDALRYIRLDASLTDSTTLARIRKSQALLALTTFHYELSSHGFARTISQAFVSTYGPKTAHNLQQLAEALEREAGFKHPYFHIN